VLRNPEQMELPAKLLDNFLWSNKSNSNQTMMISVEVLCDDEMFCNFQFHKVMYKLYWNGLTVLMIAFMTFKSSLVPLIEGL